jgi:serine/threonine protein kinase
VACDYLIQACEALSEAHTLGIVHRDLKPQNLFLTKGVGGAPLVKVLDFGISKIQQPEGAHNLTQTTTVIGSPLYMAPEQMRSARNADPRSDIWALGIVLYELLTQSLPFEAETITDLAIKIVQDPFPPLESLRPDLPPDLATVVQRCLEKEPASRFADAGELASALEPFASAASRVLAERARKVVSAHSKTLGASVGPVLSASAAAAAARKADASGPVYAISSPTHKSPSAPEAWSDTNGKPAQTPRTWVVALAAAGTALLLAFIAVRALNHGPPTVIAPVAVSAAPPLLSAPPPTAPPPTQPAPTAAAAPLPATSSSTPAPAGAAAAPSATTSTVSSRAAPSAHAPAQTSPRAVAAGTAPKNASSAPAPNPSNDDIPSLR